MILLKSLLIVTFFLTSAEYLAFANTEQEQPPVFKQGIGLTRAGLDNQGELCYIKIVDKRSDVQTLKPDFSFHYTFSQYLKVQISYMEHKDFVIPIGPKIRLNRNPNPTSHWQADFNELSGYVEVDGLDGNRITGAVEGFSLTYYPFHDFVFTRYAYDETAELDSNGKPNFLILEVRTCSLNR